ncbi:MAG: GatB/YqeY domain-containing protein [Patescibacteria group bacterium]
MTLRERIDQDLKTALRAHDERTLLVLRMVLSVIKNKAIAEKISDNLPDDKVIAIINSEAKKREDSIRMFTDGGRTDLADKEKEELKILKQYLPAQMSDEEVERQVSKIVSVSGAKDFVTAMKAVMAELKGKADGRIISDAIKRAFNE